MVSTVRESENRLLLVKGTDGFIKDEEFVVHPGGSIIIGRSRSCDISLRNTRRYQAFKGNRETVDLRFRTVSRKHLKLNFNGPNEIEIEDMSSNGTYLDGEKIKHAVIRDLSKREHSVLIGVEERFVLKLAR
ncbi:MAG: FHA domain-containing protein [Planctomycetota bacterium]|jgi:pSer/pThr/pTyr-binding forkhead associated (FHA) protein